jgi:prepilin-type N-terminal cleavage/methylation domain-containing protein
MTTRDHGFTMMEMMAVVAAIAIALARRTPGLGTSVVVACAGVN